MSNKLRRRILGVVVTAAALLLVAARLPRDWCWRPGGRARIGQSKPRASLQLS
jgi:hypothetical protein